MEMMNITEFADRHIDELSGGQKTARMDCHGISAANRYFIFR
ncbi:hypothetical protein LSPH24S_02873 [Lysinibacillus sphaericus]